MTMYTLVTRIILFGLATLVVVPMARLMPPHGSVPAKPVAVPALAEQPGMRVVDVVLTGDAPVLRIREKQIPAIAACTGDGCTRR